MKLLPRFGPDGEGTSSVELFMAGQRHEVCFPARCMQRRAAMNSASNPASFVDLAARFTVPTFARGMKQDRHFSSAVKSD
jgi:hypothetical protein